MATLRLSHSTPILPVHDADAAAAFYAALGFEVDAWGPGYAFVLHGGREVLHLQLVEGLDVDANATAAYLHVHDVDAWHARMAAAEGVGAVADEEWGMREFRVVDPSGNVVRIGQNV